MFVLSEIVLQRAIKNGLNNIKKKPQILDDIFCQLHADELSYVYGENYIKDIKNWFMSTKVPVLQAWSFDATRVPCVSIHLGNEVDDESKAAIGDFFGMGEESELKVNPMSVMLDIGIHADKSKDHVLWLYYIINHILYKEKPMFRDLGMQLVTFNASQYNKESKYMAENVWTRWIRFKCTVQNIIEGDDFTQVDDVDTSMTMSNKNDALDDDTVHH